LGIWFNNNFRIYQRMLEIDGATLEGGGQMLRSACALSCLLSMPFRMSNIRAGRPKPGLQAQHLAGVLALSKICNAKTAGAELSSTSLSFSPGSVSSGDFSFDVGTAGAVALVAQTLLPVLLFAPAPSTIVLHGGTHVPFAPTFNYFSQVLLHSLQLMGVHASATLSRYGWYPKGGGEIVLLVHPCKKLQPLNLLGQTHVTSLAGLSCASNLPPHVTARQADAARAAFPHAEIKTDLAPAASPGSAITLWARFEGGLCMGASSLGKPGKPAELVGTEAALALQAELASGAAVDRHLADQLMVFMALAAGASSIRTSEITQHARTNAWLIEKFTGKRVLIDAVENTIELDGIGLSNKYMPD